MRIWHVNVGNHAGSVDGVAVVSCRLARDQAGLGHEVSLVVAADPTHHDTVRATAGDDLKLVLTDSSVAAGKVALARLANPATRPDVVHLHSVFRPVHRILADRARRLGVPLVLSPHAGLAPLLLQRDRVRKGIYGRLVERRLCRTIDGVHALQLLEREDVVQYCGRRRPVMVIPNPVDPTLLTLDPWPSSVDAARSSGPVILLCRYDVYQKGLDRLAELARCLPDIGFRVYGSTDKNGPELAAALIRTAPENLRFEPSIHGDEKLQVLREARLFLQPSRVEGLSVALAEAMTLGVPCGVSSYVGRSLDMGAQGIALVLADDLPTAAAQLAKALEDRSRLAKLGAAARAYAAEHFAPDDVAARHLDHYRSLRD
jgi:glycosyltransferase involved in cell wall biosynthesis